MKFFYSFEMENTIATEFGLFCDEQFKVLVGYQCEHCQK